MRAILTAWVMLLALPSPAHAVDAAADAAAIAKYPQLAPGNLLVQIVAELKRSQNDPHSIRDFVLCPASNIKILGDGELARPVRWYVPISFNARNDVGGYTGKTMYGAIFRENKRVDIAAVQMAGKDGFDAIINRAIEKRMMGCPEVPDEQIAELLKSAAKPIDLNP